MPDTQQPGTKTITSEVIDAGDGVTYEPWTNGYAVGFKVTHPDGQVRYVYLNPSQHEHGYDPDVFVYQGLGDPADDAPVCYIEPFNDTPATTGMAPTPYRRQP